MDGATAVHGGSGHHDIDDLAAESARVHAQRPAQGAGHAAQEFQPLDPRRRAGLGDVHIERARARPHPGARDVDTDEATAEANNDTAYAAIANEDVGTHAEHGDRHIAWFIGEKLGQVGEIGGPKHHVRTPPHAEPGDVRQ